MKRGLDRRLSKVEARWFVSARVATILRALDARRDREPAGELLAGMGGIETLSDRELVFLLAEFNTLIAAAGDAAPRDRSDN